MTVPPIRDEEVPAVDHQSIYIRGKTNSTGSEEENPSESGQQNAVIRRTGRTKVP